MATKSATKLILIAHRDDAVRERFAASLADARHDAVTAAGADEAVAAAGRRDPALSLAVIDLGLHAEPALWIRQIRAAAQAALPVLVFAGTVHTATDIRELLSSAIAGYVNEHAPATQILPALAPHLFPASFNRRLSPRTVLSVPVTYRSDATIAGAVTLNVGRGGMAIRTLSPLDAGAPIAVKFRLPPASDEIERTGHVVWADRRVGMGIQFDEELVDAGE